VDKSYRLGLSIVLATVLASAGLCLGAAALRPPAPRAGQDLGTAFPLGTFRLTERSGRTVTDADLADRVWIASFIFTHCPLSCPRITSVMKGIQGRLDDSGVQLVSVSVDPERDTPEVLASYAKKFSADPDRWWFLTGPKDAIERLVVDRFKLGLATADPADVRAGAEAIAHSERLALVDRGNRVVGYFDSNDPGEISKLEARARGLAPSVRRVPPWVRRLPAVNATLNGTAAVLLMAGWTLIRTGRVRGHATCMLLGVATSALFLACYLVYHFQIRGGVPFRGVGPIRVVYFTILLSHVVLAVVMVPPVLLTLTLALRREFDRHARLARVAFPIWLYVSITGVVIYVMLYQLPLAATASV
jgi:protein SCO1